MHPSSLPEVWQAFLPLGPARWELMGVVAEARKDPFLGSPPLHGLPGHFPILPEGLPLSPIPLPCSTGCVRKQSPATAAASTGECRTNLFQMGQGPRSASCRAASSPLPPSPHSYSRHLCALGQDGLHFQESSWECLLFSSLPQTRDTAAMPAKL